MPLTQPTIRPGHRLAQAFQRAKETRVYGCQVSFNEIPASEVNNVETNSLVLSLVSEMVIYPAA